MSQPILSSVRPADSRGVFVATGIRSDRPTTAAHQSAADPWAPRRGRARTEDGSRVNSKSRSVATIRHPKSPGLTAFCR